VGWRKTSKSGKTFLSVKVSVMRERTQQAVTRYQAPSNNDLNDDIPF
jgi:uncharacterized protein (DUF736 family)